MREFTVQHKGLVTLVPMDNKYKVKVGESSGSSRAWEASGRQTQPSYGCWDHDFSEATLTPSVNLLVS